jgi:sterol desaturase/sphingolipid hydroxylase (fatty acid hydroxylase superfamily)
MRLSSGKNIRLFKNPILEKLTYVHPIVPIAFWGPIISYCWVVAGSSLGLGQTLLFTLAGLAIWTPSEYLLHRFVFHFKPKGPFQERLVFLFHGIHHDDPEDARRLLMPPIAAVVIGAIFFFIFAAFLGTMAAKPFFAGFIVGYLCYDYIHFAVHFANPKFAFLQKLKRNHMLHHYATPHKRYGVSSTLWDHVLGTNG